MYLDDFAETDLHLAVFITLIHNINHNHYLFMFRLDDLADADLVDVPG